MPRIKFIQMKDGEAVVLHSAHHGVTVIDGGIGALLRGQQLSTVIITHPDEDHAQGLKALWPERQRQKRENRQRDYTRVAGHTVSRSQTGAKSTSVAMPVVIGSAADVGGDGGDDGGGGDGGGDGDGDGEPPTSAGPAPDGDGQHPLTQLLLLLLALLLLAVAILGDILARPFRAIRRLVQSVPDIRTVWFCLKFLFPDAVRRDLFRPHLLSLFRDRRLARHKRLAFCVWMAVCLRLRTAVLLLRCLKATWKEAGLEGGAAES